jgi:hypothetical protein
MFAPTAPAGTDNCLFTSETNEAHPENSSPSDPDQIDYFEPRC